VVGGAVSLPQKWLLPGTTYYVEMPNLIGLAMYGYLFVNSPAPELFLLTITLALTLTLTPTLTSVNLNPSLNLNPTHKPDPSS